MQTDMRRLSDIGTCALRPMSQTDAKSVLSSLKDIAKSHPQIADLLAAETPLKDFIVAALSLSPYLRDTAVSHPQVLVQALAGPLIPYLETCIQTARDAWKGADAGKSVPDAEIMTRLRQAKRDIAFAIALADLSRLFDARETTRWLSDFAGASVSATIDHLLLSAHDAGKLNVVDTAHPSDRSGVVVLGMGKLGAFELNYSSDIDLVVFYEPQAPLITSRDDAPETFARLLRRLIRILQERTGDGYVFRTDLRLRPDPGATPLAIPVEAAMLYYESRGQNWERAAFIKARPVAGDLKAGDAFLRELTPFMFRKYLDYAAIADIHSIKRQIHAHKGHGEIAVKGHNIKLGRGGIREIEFFVQTQQLIAGGRMQELRLRATEPMLHGLARANWIDGETAEELISAYWFLRDVEHRVQMVRDEQTHVLPTTDAELKRIAYMMGFADVPAFSAELSRTLKTVERRYAQLFEQEAKLSTETGNLVFTGQRDDPDTLETLKKLGFDRPQDISRTIRTWHYGRYRATQSVEARERLTELTPELLRVFGQNKRADDALLRFDQFIAGLPAGIQLFSLLGNNPGLLSLIVNIMSSAPRLADIIASKPHVFDGMLDPRLLAELPTRDYLAERIKGFLATARHYEEILDRLRIIASEQRFLIGIRLLTGVITGVQAGHAFTDLADLILTAALDAVLREVEAAHGKFPGGRVAVIGMGKLGSHELTAGSDVDIILLYDYDDAAGESDGAKPLDSVRYFTRITQRLISALSAPTAEGVLYEVDMRLRPSGNKGPVATRINAFAKYQREEAWTWEHMALTRARALCGEESLIADVGGIFKEVLGQSRDLAKVTADVAEMRGLIDKEKPPSDVWDFKLIPGGLVDIEFIAQYLALIAPARGVAPPSSGTSTADVLALLGPALIAPADLDTVQEALALFTDLSQIVRLCIEGDLELKDAPAGLIELLCRAGDAPDIKVLEADIRRLSKAVRRIFQTTVKP
ncbi:bifunctional [glutamine synthetase] adenylyltransferase/[glutamine synthetase]-adenylyl-L-tyrosine phosphorylase [Rhizobium sp. LjRoot98]|uniref:bifunctional [glutamine synthetase] adenylyltransferase/[glutamine synthetase]-adenylyl-L-tyrosine phosphorylase n=1 Tax=unclassified Rhizobium TaxID=2613769 RepID=UPI0007129072|nr:MULTISPECIES: bifunctional [glutamine synthetase] adenylyltransferase/[glutamine synthetase]-adenylyl-L-tyrosine phosphorylase [unclassified Rhizobium]KQV37291.1 bifunctional glutamine-synthetase adenylyltransferase/deadenyltransferase [Rhizobium sp. Root1204]KQY17302.1 bifunctional glutamine-synthetase adenylyltransferase/deadenyltransferase [Rhizobium sp. Root1334]KRC13189.1 bifunctional glutamine-synthetase adenylyltransferase/deadenyltransferase [Rhizobium sp. Root73]